MRQRNREYGRLIFGKPSLSRVMCDTCEEETLHRFGRCIHCNTQHHNPQRRVEPDIGLGHRRAAA